MPRTSPLEGLRVIECTGWNGVLAGRLLAEAGADVVRVIPPAGDPLDAEPPFFGATSVSIQATFYNAGKRLLRLDLASESGHREFLELLRGADVLIEEWPAESPPIERAEVASANPAITQVSITPMGSDGPRANWRVNDLVANAMCGSAWVTGDPSSPPISGYGNQSHHTVGLYAAVAALAAHRFARTSGRGVHVDLSGHEALVSCTEQVLMQWFFPGGTWGTPIARRQGSLHWSGAYEVYPAKDGRGVMVTASLKLTEVLVPWLIECGAAQDLADREKYPDVIAMVKDLPYVMKVLREWVATWDGEALFYEGQRRHQPFGVVWNVGEAVERSPQIRARDYLYRADVPGVGTVQLPGRFFRTDADGPPPEPAREVTRPALSWAPRRPAPSPAAISADPALPLAGVRILDFTHVLAGPFGTRVLADLGAEVLKVGSAKRSGGANSPDHPYYVCWNRNKRSVALDMSLPEARAVARDLALRCDIVIENFSAGVLERWGLDRASLAADHPGITVISMGGMGRTGPWKEFVTYAPTIHALTGLTYLTNPEGTFTDGYGFSLTDHLSGLAAALAALEGLEHRERTGEGLAIDLAQYELGLGIMGPAIIDYLANGTNPEPRGNRHPFDAWAPHGIYPCAGDDRWVAIAARGDDEWQRLAGMLGIDPGGPFATHSDRIANWRALDAVISNRTRTMDAFELAERLQRAGVHAGPVQHAGDLAERDPQLAARDFFGTAYAERWGEYSLDRFPARFDGRRPPRYEGVHQVGQDTFVVLAEVLGYDDERIAHLMAIGALT
ncbi:CoA transferase [Tepidiforma sp.]|uniref:CaiB/BaiF CoA-transferase family protein n=1 Tax=Tepidiforma sp. TaxID=2682230 RepID=UPI002ADE31C9|nr:CoA transferase [Tepidiforma sp.]